MSRKILKEWMRIAAGGLDNRPALARGGHLKWRPPGGGVTIVTSSHPTGGMGNDRSRLRKAGLNIP